MISRSDISNVINESFEETLEDVGFIETTAVPSEGIKFKHPIAFRLKVLMPYIGDVVLILDLPLGEKILQNAFPDEKDEAMIYDSVGELLNVFVGKLMDKLYPEKPFKIGIPEKIAPDSFDIEHSYCHGYIDPEDHKILLYSKFEMSHL